MTAPAHDVEVAMTGEDGNAFAIIGRVTKALKAAGVDADARKAFTDKAMAGDYDHLLRVVMETVNVT
ncbi:MAG: hypothetical protein KAI41_09610 [Hyphomicrobiaceae bacterium]|nr:hypothetical protein [Hyphomicrobiaceae bacterium]